jgi:hypothetical protein
MDSYFVSSAVIAVIYLLFKFGEMRLVLKEPKPMKDLIRDTIVVYISSILGMFVIDQVEGASLRSAAAPTGAFTGKPEF